MTPIQGKPHLSFSIERLLQPDYTTTQPHQDEHSSDSSPGGRSPDIHSPDGLSPENSPDSPEDNIGAVCVDGDMIEEEEDMKSCIDDTPSCKEHNTYVVGGDGGGVVGCGGVVGGAEESVLQKLHKSCFYTAQDVEASFKGSSIPISSSHHSHDSSINLTGRLAGMELFLVIIFV